MYRDSKRERNENKGGEKQWKKRESKKEWTFSIE